MGEQQHAFFHLVVVLSPSSLQKKKIEKPFLLFLAEYLKEEKLVFLVALGMW